MRFALVKAIIKAECGRTGSEVGHGRVSRLKLFVKRGTRALYRVVGHGRVIRLKLFLKRGTRVLDRVVGLLFWVKRGSAEKLLLSLLVIACLVGVVWLSYVVFTHRVSPIVGVPVLLAWVWLTVSLVRILGISRYRWRKPGFKRVLAYVLAVVLVCAFAGVSPLASYKDAVVDEIRDVAGGVQDYFTTTPEEAAQVAIQKEQTLVELEKETFRLINVERGRHGIPPLVWDEALHSGARTHSQNMQRQGYLYHATGGSFAECCYGASHVSSIYGTAEATVEAWMSSTAGHREILLDGGYRYGAVGITRDKGFFATFRCY